MKRKSLGMLLSGALLGGGLAVGALHVTPVQSQTAPSAPPAAAQQHAQTPLTPKMQAPPEARNLSRSFTSVAKALRPSVVRIDVEIEAPKVASRGGGGRGAPQQVPPELRDFFERFFGGGGDDGENPFEHPGPGRGTGSGFIFDGAGHVVTNSHVVKGATKVKVTLADGREFPAKVVGTDDQTDVAVVQLEKPPQGLVAARLGDPDKLEVGEWVLAVGSPLGMDQTVTAGIISGKGKVGRNVPRMSGEKVREYIQTDAKINPGNSGGPLVNLEGEVVGINTLINVGAGGAYGFAIPVNQARRVAETLIKEGRVRYAYLGVRVGDVSDLAEEARQKLPKGAPEKAAIVSDVVVGSPAAQAGVRPGDIITQLDNQKVEGKEDVVGYVSARPIGSKVRLSFLRDGKPSTALVTLAELPNGDAQKAGEPVSQERLGVGLQTLTQEMARFLGLDPNAKGAVITEVVPGSRAAKAGLQAEDVIIEVNRKAVTSAEEATAAIRDAAKGAVMLKVRRGGAARYVTVPAP